MITDELKEKPIVNVLTMRYIPITNNEWWINTTWQLWGYYYDYRERRKDYAITKWMQ